MNEENWRSKPEPVEIAKLNNEMATDLAYFLPGNANKFLAGAVLLIKPLHVKHLKLKRARRPKNNVKKVKSIPSDQHAEEQPYDDNEYVQDASIDDSYPWPLWSLMFEGMQVQEDPNIIHDVCVALQASQIDYDWQLKQVLRSFLEQVFPIDSHPRH